MVAPMANYLGEYWLKSNHSFSSEDFGFVKSTSMWCGVREILKTDTACYRKTCNFAQCHLPGGDLPRGLKRRAAKYKRARRNSYVQIKKKVEIHLKL